MRAIFTPHLLRIERFYTLKLIELVLILVIISLSFASVYWNIYQKDPKSFVKAVDASEPITFFDFFYFGTTIFFSLGYDVIPQSPVAKTAAIIQMFVSFIALTIMLSNLLQPA